MDPVIIAHGGAWAIPDSLVESSQRGVEAAARAGWKVLQEKGSALDAVEAAVRGLEDDPAFDAGTGSVLTMTGEVELDAMIMDGKGLRVGAVACVQNIKNPVSLARLVMDKSDHVLLVGKGANQFAEENGVATVPKEELVTPEAVAQWERFRKYRNTVNKLFSERDGHDTVGCVAIDMEGNIAAGTSTGGITAKRPGRVGDSPLVGCGGYADNLSAGVSCTGHGESIAKVCLAKGIADACGNGAVDLSGIVTLKLNNMTERVEGAGGAICIDKNGNYGFGFNTQRMAWAVISSRESISGINPQEKKSFI